MKQLNQYQGLGIHQKNALAFIKQCSGWHSYTNDQTTKRAIEGLNRRNLIFINEFNQFKFNTFLR
jgi:hypothetical protein